MTTPTDTDAKARAARRRQLIRVRQTLEAALVQLECLHQPERNLRMWLSVPLLSCVGSASGTTARALCRIEGQARDGCTESAEWMAATAELRAQVDRLNSTLPEGDPFRPMPFVGGVASLRHLGRCRLGKRYGSIGALRAAVAEQEAGIAAKAAERRAATQAVHIAPVIEAQRRREQGRIERQERDRAEAYAAWQAKQERCRHPESSGTLPDP